MERAADMQPATGSWAGLFATATTLARKLRAVVSQHAGQHGLTEAQFALLWQCQQAAAARQGQNELAQALAFSTAQISTLVEQLRQCGWLVSSRDPVDRRRQCWHATPAGDAVTRRVIRDLEAWAAQRGLHHEATLPIALSDLLGGMDAEPRGLPAVELRVCVPEDTSHASPIQAEDER